MTTEPNFTHISLAVAEPAFSDAAIQMCSTWLPDIAVHITDLADFAQSSDSLNVLLIRCDDSGLLDPGDPGVQVLLTTHVPVLVVRWNGKGEPPKFDIQRIVVPLDGSALAAQAIPLASGMAKILGAPVRFVMVIDPSRVIPPAYAYDPDAWGLIEELRQTSHWALSQAESAVRAEGIQVESDLLFGPINASLMAHIVDGDLVVMTSHGNVRHGQRNRESVVLRTLVSVPHPMFIMQASREIPVVVDGYQACSWVEPLQPRLARTT